MQGFDAHYMAIPPDRQFHSIGNACQLLQVTPQMLRALLDECNLEFGMAIDGCPMLTGAQLKILSDRYNAHVDNINEHIDAARDAASRN